MRTRILFVTGIISPFWIELAKAISDFGDLEFRIAFCDPSLASRGKHWQRPGIDLDRHYTNTNNSDLTTWLWQVYADCKPDVVIAGGIRNNASRVIRQISRNDNVLFGFFGEQPNQSNKLLQQIKLKLYKRELSKAQPDFFLAAGDKAVDIYRTLSPSQCHVAMFPYYQDLSAALEFERNNIQTPLRFLFSGRLIPRNSIRAMTGAFEKLAETHTGKFTWCISAYGEEEGIIREAISRSPNLEKAVSFDRDFEEWNDRLRPFFNSDVLVVPAVHSGWGLVVPEALAAGLPVITTRGVEAARYFVEDMTNGMFVEPESECIYQALKYCVDHPKTLSNMQKNARQAALKGDVRYGAERFRGLLLRWLDAARSGLNQ